MVRRPFSAKRVAQRRERVRRAEKSAPFLFKIFRKISGKELTKKNATAFLETFPLKRNRFFEIYFVRLIGTPNQHIPRRETHLSRLGDQRKLVSISSS